MRDDLISRQAAIDAIDRERKNKHLFNTAEDGLLEARGVINTLPSAEPEIIRCKDCRHGVDYYHEGDCYCSNPKWGLMYFGGSWEFYCADAERRTDG